MRSIRRFLTRRHSGSIAQESAEYTKGIVDSRDGSDVSDQEIVDMALEIAARRMLRGGAALLNPRATQDYLRLKISHLEYEVFGVLYLDNRHRVIACDELFRGTLDGASVYPREVIKEALRHNAAALVIFHQHPSGLAEPSQADEQITRRLKEACALVEIRLLDHLVVGANHCESFADRGLL